MGRTKDRILQLREPSKRYTALDQISSLFRRMSWILVFVGLVGMASCIVFADIPTDRHGRPKRPLRDQLVQAGMVVLSGMPGSVWGIVRACNSQQKTPWD